MRDKLKKINDYSFELPKSGKMNVPGKIYSSENLLSHPGMSSAIKQVADVATLQESLMQVLQCLTYIGDMVFL